MSITYGWEGALTADLVALLGWRPASDGFAFSFRREERLIVTWGKNVGEDGSRVEEIWTPSSLQLTRQHGDRAVLFRAFWNNPAVASTCSASAA